MLAQEFQIYREVFHQPRLQAIVVKVVHVWDVRRNTLLILVRVELRNECGVMVTTIGESHTRARNSGGGVQLQARLMICVKIWGLDYTVECPGLILHSFIKSSKAVLSVVGRNSAKIDLLMSVYSPSSLLSPFCETVAILLAIRMIVRVPNFLFF